MVGSTEISVSDRQTEGHDSGWILQRTHEWVQKVLLRIVITEKFQLQSKCFWKSPPPTHPQGVKSVKRKNCG